MEDTISREAAINTIFLILCMCNMKDPEDLKNMLLLAFQEMPSAQPERKVGKWLELTNTNHTYVCSVCGRMLVNITDGKNTVTKNYPFCHCGADMRGEER